MRGLLGNHAVVELTALTLRCIWWPPTPFCAPATRRVGLLVGSTTEEPFNVARPYPAIYWPETRGQATTTASILPWQPQVENSASRAPARCWLPNQLQADHQMQTTLTNCGAGHGQHPRFHQPQGASVPCLRKRTAETVISYVLDASFFRPRQAVYVAISHRGYGRVVSVWGMDGVTDSRRASP